MSTFRKSVEEIQVSLKSDKNKRYFTWRPVDTCDSTRWIFLRMRNVAENQNTHFVFSNLFFPENRDVYDIVWKNIVNPNRPQMTIWHMRIACYIPKSTNTPSEYVILIAFPLQQWLHQSA